MKKINQIIYNYLKIDLDFFILLLVFKFDYIFKLTTYFFFLFFLSILLNLLTEVLFIFFLLLQNLLLL